MAVDVIMPQMGESVAEGTIVRWLKEVGDSVDRDEPIFEITTDKVDAEIPAPEAGVLLEIKVQAGETVEVGTPVAVIGSADEGAGKGAAPKGGEAEAPAEDTDEDTDTDAAEADAADRGPATGEAAPGDKPRAEMSAAELRRTRSTPVVRKIAEEHGVDIGDVDGTGLDGRVTKKDILAYIEAGGPAKKKAAAAKQAEKPAEKKPQAAEAPRMPAPPAARAEAPQGKVSLGAPMVPVRMRENDTWEPMSRMRRSISDHMIQSKQYSAHVHTCFEVDYGNVDRLRRKYKQQYADRGAKLTFTTFLARATIKALQAHPIVNSSHDGENVVFRGDINLGIAVALDWGLIVPVVHHADELSMVGLSKRIADLGERARTKKLKPEEASGLTFSITNPGIFGSQWGTPIIPQPSVAILGVGTIEKRAKVVTLPGGGDAIVPKLCGYLTLGFDHRVIDGAVADQFMVTLKGILESFDDSAM